MYIISIIWLYVYYKFSRRRLTSCVKRAEKGIHPQFAIDFSHFGPLCFHVGMEHAVPTALRRVCLDAKPELLTVEWHRAGFVHPDERLNVIRMIVVDPNHRNNCEIDDKIGVVDMVILPTSRISDGTEHIYDHARHIVIDVCFAFVGCVHGGVVLGAGSGGDVAHLVKRF